ncbi:Maltase 1, partial [Acromyrmex echinatior]
KIHNKPWWNNSVVYQIYSRSFCDSNADEIGDLKGITSKLDYIAETGINAIWLSSIYTSSMIDFGYDKFDFVDIDPIFGSLKDFKALLARAKKLGLKKVLKFWLDLGIDGFYVDSSPFIYEDSELRDELRSDVDGMVCDATSQDYKRDYLEHNYTMNLIDTYKLFREWRHFMDSYTLKHNQDQKLMMMEAYTDPNHTMQYYDYALLSFNFKFIININAKSSAQEFKQQIDLRINSMPRGKIANWALGNRIGSALSSSLEESELTTTPSTPSSSPQAPALQPIKSEEQLGRRKLRLPRTFTCNMHAFGLSRALCTEFLRKQCIIANLTKGDYSYLFYIFEFF